MTVLATIPSGFTKTSQVMSERSDITPHLSHSPIKDTTAIRRASVRCRHNYGPLTMVRCGLYDRMYSRLAHTLRHSELEMKLHVKAFQVARCIVAIRIESRCDSAHFSSVGLNFGVYFGHENKRFSAARMVFPRRELLLIVSTPNCARSCFFPR